jgi:hypothetical protein
MGGGPATGTNGRMKRRGVVKVVGRAPMRSHLSLQEVTAYQPHRQEESAGITCDTNEVVDNLQTFALRFYADANYGVVPGYVTPLRTFKLNGRIFIKFRNIAIPLETNAYIRDDQYTIFGIRTLVGDLFIHTILYQCNN